jgi:hypothetical protein
MRNKALSAAWRAAFVALVLPVVPAAGQPGDTAITETTVHRDPVTKAGLAGRCQIGPGLGSTLLVPFFEVDLTDTNGPTTLISVNNGYASPTLTRLVMWTDWGIPTLAFDIYLEGFDVQTISVRNLFDGQIPATGIGVDLSGFPFCVSLPPSHANPALTPGEIQQLVTAHTGVAGHIDGLCYGAAYGDQVARGFITVDVVDECSGLEGFDPLYTPANTTYPYFAEGGGPSGIAIVENRLWGDVVYVDFTNNFAQGSEAVSIWADDAEFPGTGVYTFYGRHSGWDGRDERVPLPWRWDQRFLNGGVFAGGADLIVFHSPDHFSASPTACGSAPAWWPQATNVASLDEEASNLTSYPDNLFGLVTQRVPISSLAPPYDFGWVQIDSLQGQMWVQPSLSAMGRLSAGFNGFPVGFRCEESPPVR